MSDIQKRIKKVEIGLGRTVPLPHNEFFRVHISMAAEFDGDYTDEEYEDLRHHVYHKLQLQVAKILPY